MKQNFIIDFIFYNKVKEKKHNRYNSQHHTEYVYTITESLYLSYILHYKDSKGKKNLEKGYLLNALVPTPMDY